MIAQLTPTYGLNLSPIRLIFQKNPNAPVRFIRVSPGCNVLEIKRIQSGYEKKRWMITTTNMS